MSAIAKSWIAGVRARAQTCLAAKTALDEGFRTGLRKRDSTLYDELATAFRLAQAVVLPDGGRELAALIDKSDARSIKYGITFIEADLWYFNSGYHKQCICRSLKRAPLTESQKKRLREFVLHVVDNNNRPEMRAYCRLAASLRNENFELEITARLQSGDPDQRYRAQEVAIRRGLIEARDKRPSDRLWRMLKRWSTPT